MTSQLPLIVSLEIHASIEQQEIVAAIIKEYWIDLLADSTFPWTEIAAMRLPSPHKLLRKILLKVKQNENKYFRLTGSDFHKNVEEDKMTYLSSSSSDEDKSLSGKNENVGESRDNKKITDSLSSLSVYTRAYKFKNFTQPGWYYR